MEFRMKKKRIQTKENKQAFGTYNRMLNAPVNKLICRLAAPTMVTMLITAAYNLADTYFAGQIGKEETAAIGVTFSFLALLQAFSYFIGQGAGNYMARLLGAKNGALAECLAAVAFFTALFCGCVFAIGGAIFTEPLVFLLGATETIAPIAIEYTRILTLGIPFIMTSFVMNNLLRFQGRAFYGMIGIGIGSMLNIILDPIFMFGLSMGIAGAAVATVLSQIISFAILLLLCNKGENIQIHLRNFHPSVTVYKEIIRGGFPALCRQGLTSVAALALNWSVKAYGDAAIAAFSIVSRVTGFAYSALMGFGQGFQPFCGFNYGAGKYKRVREGYGFCVKTAVVALTGIAAVLFFFAVPVTALFETEDAEVLQIAVKALRFQCITLPLLALVIMANMLTQTMGWAKSATVLSIARQGIFFLPVLALLAYGFGLKGVFLAQPVADVCSAGLAVFLGRRTVRLLQREEG